MLSSESYVLFNVCEQNIRMQAEEKIQKEQPDMCTCERCFLTVCMRTLNALPNQYVTSQKGEIITKVHTTAMESNVAILVALTTAIEFVKENPPH